MLRLKVCMIASMLQGSIWINTYLNLPMKSPRDLRLHHLQVAQTMKVLLLPG